MCTTVFPLYVPPCVLASGVQKAQRSSYDDAEARDVCVLGVWLEWGLEAILWRLREDSEVRVTEHGTVHPLRTRTGYSVGHSDVGWYICTTVLKRNSILYRNSQSSRSLLISTAMLSVKFVRAAHNARISTNQQHHRDRPETFVSCENILTLLSVPDSAGTRCNFPLRTSCETVV